VPVKLPTIAIFFTAHDFLGVPLVTFPKGTGLFGGSEIKVDANTPGQLNQMRNNIINTLNSARDVLNMLDFLNLFPPIDAISEFIGELAAVGAAAIDSHGKIDDVSELVIENTWHGAHNFNDEISSVILIGLPHVWSHTVVKCWENPINSGKPGNCLRLCIPDNQFFTAIPCFKHLDNPNLCNPNDQGGHLNMTFTLPHLDTDTSWPGPDISDNNFNDKLTGIEFC
jgi:hypothetical protein